MKKILFIFLLLITFIPSVKAKEFVAKTEYIDINSEVTLDDENGIVLQNFSFKPSDLENPSRLFTGGSIKIDGNDTETIYLDINFYDSEYNFLFFENITNICHYGTCPVLSYVDLPEDIIDKIQYYTITLSKKKLNIFSSDSNQDYSVTEYNVDILVNENNVLDIEEYIKADFYREKHGIYIQLPIRTIITRPDGTSIVNRASVSDIKINDEFSINKGLNYLEMKIGDPYLKILGEKDYEVKYSYNLGKDRAKGYDELLFNIVTSEWDTSVKNVTFKIWMPKDFDKDNLEFYCSGNECTDDVLFTVNKNIISGEYLGDFSPGEDLVVYLKLPDGYFVGASLNIDNSFKVMVGVPLLLLAISFIMWLKWGKDYKRVSTIEFYPPDGLNSLEIAHFYKGKVKEKDALSLMVYLANKKYIKIIESEDKKSFTVEKLKDYDGNNDEERMFFNGLFKKDDKVTSEYLTNNFYETVQKILNKTNDKKIERVYEAINKKKSIFAIIGAIISGILIVVNPLLIFDDPLKILMLISVVILGIVFVVSLFSTNIVFASLFCVPFAIPLLYYIELDVILMLDSLSLFGFIVGVGCIIGMVIISKFMPKRSIYSADMLARIKGFKRFLITVEKDKLEAMVEENPSYFYDILPYTYVLGISDKWIKKFETISVNVPDWYNTSSTFNVASLNTITYIKLTRPSRASSNSSSGHSSSSSYRSSSSSRSSSVRGSGGGRRGSW